MHIALDAMGGDRGPSVIVEAAVTSLLAHPDLILYLVGDQAILANVVRSLSRSRAFAKHWDVVHSRLQIRHAPEVVEMHESPASAFRTKKKSSMRQAIELVKSKEAQACISCGNTGALMTIARFVLKTVPGIDRPAIITAMPTLTGHAHLLDLGANVDCSTEHLFQFALMGSLLVQLVDHLDRPRVGLLNIGSEENKGNEQVKEVAQYLSQTPLIHYIGYVEGDDIYKGRADVIVCDGFVGNVALKTSEGLAKMISHAIREEFTRHIGTRLGALLVRPILNALSKRLDPSQYNGATLIGLQGIVLKSHGSANALGMTRAIEKAICEIKEDVPKRLQESMSELIKHSDLELLERKEADSQ